MIDSAQDWEKIFYLGAQKNAAGMQAPMVKYLVENDLTLSVAGARYGKGELAS